MISSGTTATRENALVGLALGMVAPLIGSWVWYYSKTVIEITDPEQTFWIQTWIQRECSQSIQSLRRLVLGGASQTSTARMRRNAASKMPMAPEENLEEKEGGRFATPKLFFRVPVGWSMWAWYGGWPVSIACGDSKNQSADPYSNESKPKSYFLTVWFAPNGLQVAKNVLLKGRELYLETRAKRTEIWIAQIMNYGYGSSGGRNTFSTVSRPSRPMDTVIIEGNTKQLIKEDAIQFLNGERWYVEKGIPYRRGYLLYGPPGCGKTSLVTALAGDLRLPIVVVNLGTKDMTDSNLIKFLSEIPRDSIVLLEDIDCAVRMNGKSSNNKKSESIVPPKGKDGGTTRASEGGGGVTLSGLLNAIDGVGAQEGRLLFMTTNYVDDLDEALVRPGRVDAKFQVGKATKDGAGKLFDQFFQTKDDGSSSGNEQLQAAARAAFLEKVNDRSHSFAELQGVLMKARDDPTKVEASMDEFLASSQMTMVEG